MTDSQITKETRVLLKNKELAEESLRQVHDNINSAKLAEENAIRDKNKAESLLKTVQVDIDRYIGRRHVLEIDLNDTNTELSRKRSELTEISKSLESMQSKTDSFTESIRLQEEERRAYLEGVFTRKSAEIENLVNQKEVLKRELAEISTAIEKGRQDVRDSAVRVEAANNKVIKLEKDVELLESQQEALTREIAQATDKLTAIKAQRVEEEANIAQLQSTNKVLTKKIEDQNKESEDLEIKIKAQEDMYEVERKKLFQVSSREKAVNEREEYIKRRYAEAGITYQEIEIDPNQ